MYPENKGKELRWDLVRSTWRLMKAKNKMYTDPTIPIDNNGNPIFGQKTIYTPQRSRKYKKLPNPQLRGL